MWAAQGAVCWALGVLYLANTSRPPAACCQVSRCLLRCCGLSLCCRRWLRLGHRLCCIKLLAHLQQP